jgi:hypothetical protein
MDYKFILLHTSDNESWLIRSDLIVEVKGETINRERYSDAFKQIINEPVTLSWVHYHCPDSGQQVSRKCKELPEQILKLINE